ncbi:MAG: S23-interacting protein [Trichoglossum hirsutum]|nr:MAG: S23-interacting protein [Trichoglossum hirsutum]
MSHLSTPTHTYGPTCAFYKPTHETSSLTPPAVRAQSFYTSYLSIDDPISPIPPPVGSSTNVSKLPPRPFSAHDSAALEEAWLGLTKKEPKKEPKKERSHHNHGRDKAVRISEPNNTTSDTTHHDKHGQRRHSKDKSSDVPAAEGIKEGSQKKKPKASKKTPWKSTKDHTRGDGEPNKSPTCEQEHSDSAGSALRRRFDHKAAYKKYGPKYKQRKSGSLTLKTQLSDATLHGTSPSEADTTGTPFVRAPSRLDRPRSAMMSDLADENEVDAQADEGDESAEQTSAEQTSPSRPSSRNSSHPSVRGSKSKSRSRSRSRSRNLQYSQKSKDQEATVPVGVFRLHLVRLPMMRLEPIYWSSVHDTSEVIRGTWFFRDSYLPVDSEVAQMLEAGYLELKPWTETWNDELNCAIEVGAEAEAKIIHRLYPNKSPKSADASGPNCDHTTGTSGTCGDERCVERLDLGGGVGPDKLHVGASQPRVNTSYSNASVIYLDSREAYILRPNLVPSPPYRYRRPLASIRKGKTTGIPVVRGFDWQAWEKIHPQKKSATTIRMQEGFNAPQSGTADVDSGVKCEACSKQEEIPTVTDLILVIHGIGQKLSERVESFNFTHAINSFRRMINVEMRNEYVKQQLKPGQKGMMVLPVNWRSTLSFEDGGPLPVCEDGEPDPAINHFNLNDITPGTIPAVRNLISDVMLDIPYYLSHHKPRVIKAVIMEANRIYSLWCKNNPDFDRTGRVHLVAHSLGSAMALDILSKQPTRLPKENRLSNRAISERLLFDTKCLFLVGSPAGFFLLLNRKSLLPRKGRNKVDMDGEDIGEGVAGDVGTYGCLAMDNLYNVMHLSDPIAYRLNAAVDCEYARSIKTALIPSASTTLFESVSNAIKSIAPISSTTGSGQLLRPSVALLPSVVEMETHNFTREEIAEKRMCLLNDNGQVDWFLSTGTGAWEIQYLNMLGAHSSYWYSRDFARFLCLEVGRKEGRTNTLVHNRPAKSTFRKY